MGVRRSLKDAVLEPAPLAQLRLLVRLTKSRSILFSQWGFDEFEAGGAGRQYQQSVMQSAGAEASEYFKIELIITLSF